MHPGLSCGPGQHAASHGSTWVYSGNAAAVVGVAICVFLLLWWMYEKAKETNEEV